MSHTLETSKNHALETTVTAPEIVSAVKPEWRRPVITRIDIKRTLSGTGSQADFFSFTS